VEELDVGGGEEGGVGVGATSPAREAAGGGRPTSSVPVAFMASRRAPPEPPPWSPGSSMAARAKPGGAPWRREGSQGRWEVAAEGSGGIASEGRGDGCGATPTCAMRGKAAGEGMRSEWIRQGVRWRIEGR
jgi:hypothetical protein